MRIALFTPFAVSAVLALMAPSAARKLRPFLASWLLALAAVVAGAGWAAALGMLGFTLIDRFPDLAAEGGWSSGELAEHMPVGWPVAAVCALTLVACAGALAVAVYRRGRLLLVARRHSRALAPGREIEVVDDAEPDAYALPGSPGRIVVTSGMLRALDKDERGALIAHERTHLRHRHHVFLLVFHLAGAVNPLLRPVERAGAFALERWADEEAAVAVGDRPLVARAVARAALAAGRRPRHGLAVTGGPVPQRVQALLAPPPPSRRYLVVAHVALMAVCGISLILSAQDMDHLFDMAAPGHLSVSTRHHVTDPDGHRLSDGGRHVAAAAGHPTRD
ncbi:M56 family metallopeptidase [Streptomyces sp. NRRL F-5126]|uniref:M56 family metallopeptidase n=1 Tax=Streptomyces sp. NRRL F-5126 TaxID=1463857 RepID=UPI000690A5C1|nr:M56 family metallopeptidase [Streptomyces sp. NRRL F-5126]